MKSLALLPYLAVAALAAPQVQHVLTYVAVPSARQIPELPADLPGGVAPPNNTMPPADLPQPPADLPGGISPPSTNMTQPPADLPQPPADLPQVPGVPGGGGGGGENSTQPGPPSADVPSPQPPADLPVNTTTPATPGVPGGGGGAENGTGSDQGGGLVPAIPGAGGVVQLVQLPVVRARSLPIAAQQPYVTRERILVPVRPQYVHAPYLQQYAVIA